MAWKTIKKAFAITLITSVTLTVLLFASPTRVAAAVSAFAAQGTGTAWGTSYFGQLGNGTNDDSNTPVKVSNLSGATTVIAGEWHSLAIMGDSTVRAWGWNGRGQLGNGTYDDSNTPVQVSGLSGVVAVSAGGSHNLALMSDGTVMSWGYNEYGQLGDGTNTNSNTPVPVSGLSGVIAVSAGGRHSLALLGNRTVMAWGYNNEGELGNGTNGPGTDSNTPVQVSGLSDVIAISAGYYHSLAKMGDGTVRSWGSNDSGRLGDGTNADSNLPVKIPGLSGVVAISAGAAHSLTKMKDGSVRSWGFNGWGQLGNGTNINSNVPVEVSGLSGVTAVSAGGGQSLALMGDGTIRSWGYNNSGQLGDGTNDDRKIPVEVYGHLRVATVSAGGWHCMALSAPTITGITPDQVHAGRSGFILKISGTGFISGSIARWNGADRTTTYVSSTELQALIPSGDITSAGAAQVTVFNPGPNEGTSNTRRFIVNPPGISFSEYAIPSDECSARGITTGPDARIWFTEVYSRKIGRLATTGSFHEYEIPTIASGPYGITSGPDGAVWYTKWFDNAVGRITTTGDITEYLIPTVGGSPRGIASGPDGALWFVELYGNKIGRITTAGVITEYDLAPGSMPFQITAGPDGALWFTEYGANKIGRITTAGKLKEYVIPTSGCMAFGIAAGPDGALWFTESADAGNKIGRITTAGAIAEYDIPSPASMPLGIVAGPDRALWFAECNSDKIGRITTKGVVNEYDIPTADSHPFGITLGSDKALWFAETGGNKIGRLALQRTVNASVSGGHGKVTPLTQILEYGGTASIDIKPDTGYYTAMVTDNGAEVTPTPRERYTINGLDRDHQVTVRFGSVSSSWYLAEGSAAWGFDTLITIQNPNTSAVDTRVTYMPVGAADRTEIITLPPKSQTTLATDHLVSVMGGKADFSTRVECTDHSRSIAVDRTMTWRGEGASSSEAHSSVGVTSPEKTWYLPEGSSNWGFECWVLIQNPNPTAANVTLNYMVEGEGRKSVSHRVEPNSRATFDMSRDIGNKDASIQVASDLPVIAERSMYRNNRREGHCSVGATSPASDFYLAEGTTDYGFTTYVLIQNPNDAENAVTVTYMTPRGPVPTAPFTMPAHSRKTIRVNDVTEVSKTDLSTLVQGTLPIVAERAMYWDSGTGEACHDSVGLADPHTTFYLPDGESNPETETWTLVQNPNDTGVKVEITYMTPTGKGNVTFNAWIPAYSRRTFDMSEKIEGRASIMVTSKTPGGKIISERAMYRNSRGSGTDTIGGYGDEP
jgi:alpha-tubulin suppressor-like RCC1 family protein/streptogramin lyase